MNQCAFYGNGVVYVRSAEEDESMAPPFAIPAPSMFSPDLNYHHRFVRRHNHHRFHHHHDNYGYNHQANAVVCPRPRRASLYPTGPAWPLLHWRMMSPDDQAAAASGEIETAAYPGAGSEKEEGPDVVLTNKDNDDDDNRAGLARSVTNNTTTASAAAAAAISISNITTGQLELELASSPPFFSGSPPSRVPNPLIHDPRFLEGLSPPAAVAPSSPSAGGARRGGGGGGGGGEGGGCVRVRYGNSPAVRIEGFEAGFDRLDRGRSRNCSVPALA